MTGDEKYLFEQLRKGDETAFKVIYKRYVPRLYYFVYEYVPLSDIAENIVQDTFMVLWDKKSTLADLLLSFFEMLSLVYCHFEYL